MPKLITNSPEQTETIGQAIGRQLKGGEVIEMVSDLGGGKTTLVKGLARGVGSNDHVTSPTFTISKIYRGPELLIHHYDFYRIPEAGVVAWELGEALEDPKAVIVAEWAEGVESVLPDRLTIKISVLAETKRGLELIVPKQLEYLVAELPALLLENT